MRVIAAAIGLTLVATAASSDVVAPENVVYGEYGEVEAPLSAQAGDPTEGRTAFSSRALGNYVACHSDSEIVAVAQWHGNVGPSLDGAGHRWTQDDLRGPLANAKNVYDGTIMPAFYKTTGFIRPGEGFTTKPAQEPLAPLLSAQQIEDVVAYLMTLKE